MSLLLTLSVLTLSSCAVAYNSKVSQAFISDVQSPDFGNSIDNRINPLKKGAACAKNILGIFSFGDASVSEAMKNGEITKVHHVDNDSFNVLQLYAKACTVVYGE